MQIMVAPDSLDEMRKHTLSTPVKADDPNSAANSRVELSNSINARMQQMEFSRIDSQRRHNALMKDLYREQLDEIMRKKMEVKELQKQRNEDERKAYNDRIGMVQEAEKMKDLSYKNYYQLLANNQSAMASKYVNPFNERDALKDKLIQSGVEEERRRSQAWYDHQQRRLQGIKKEYKLGLREQIDSKQARVVQEQSDRQRIQSEISNNSFSPLQIDKYERERKLFEMQKYKEDLDRTRINNDRSHLLSPTRNDFNIHNVDTRHDLLLNPLPFNQQNPYILREIQRRMPNARFPSTIAR